MLFTISTSGASSDALGYLLHKHPDRVQHFDQGASTAHVFYPRHEPGKCTAALLLEVDPVELVKGKRFKGALSRDAQYASDRPYAASSLLAVALGRVFRTAIAGTCTAKPELVDAPLPLTITLTAVPCAAAGDPAALFAPLGWDVATERIQLEPQFPQWGDAPYANVTLTGTMTVQAALQHVHVLLPVLDGGQHYWVGTDEVTKLLRDSGTWLPTHPERERILRTLLARQGSLIRSAREQLDAHADPLPAQPAPMVDVERRVALRTERITAVLQALVDVGATSVVDIGCGEGQLMAELMEYSRFRRILGTDVAAGELARAERKLRLAELPETAQHRVQLRQSSAVYADDALAGFDAAVLMEVIEHLDIGRLPDLVHNVFGHAAPRAVIVTTPNAEYNALYPNLAPGQFRHADHRFEWDRATFEDWAHQVAHAHSYSVNFTPIGPVDQTHGAPTQMAVFTR